MKSKIRNNIFVFTSIIALIMAFIIMNQPAPEIALEENSPAMDYARSIRIIDQPLTVRAKCSEWKTGSILLENREDKPALVEFTAVTDSSIRILYPEQYTVMPDSVQKMRFFVVMDCAETDRVNKVSMHANDLMISFNVTRIDY